jgi:DNA repair exonuclease SbcCD ATPase subunit
MKIEKINIQNFYSFKHAEVDVKNYSGLTVIKGKNEDTGGSNGSGKSALVEAIYFGLTGKTIRKSTEDSLVNNQEKKKCVVEVTLTHEKVTAVITRQKKPTKLSFIVDGVDMTKESVSSTQKAIDEYFNINHKVLLASMFFGQANDTSFLECTPDDKRTIIRNFLNLDDLFNMRDRIKAHKSTFYQSVKERDAVITENLKRVKGLEGKLQDIEEGKKEYSDYDEAVLNLTLDDILKAEEDQRSLGFDISAYRREIATLEDYAAGLNYTIKNPLEPDVCPTCGAETEPEVNVDEKKKELKNTTLAVKDWKKKLKDLETKVEDPPISSSQFSKIQGYKDLCRDEDTYVAMITELLESNSDCASVKEENKTWYEIMRFWEKAFSEQGIIKYIVRNVLSYFNSRCNFYLSYLTNSKYFIEFDEELVEKIETEGHLVQYISLSGGEKRKINLAVTLGLKDLLLLTDKSHLDLLFFDEVAENIDEEGIFGLYQLLQEIKKNKSIFIITHNKYLKTLLDSSPRLSIIKRKGISTLKE